MGKPRHSAVFLHQTRLSCSLSLSLSFPLLSFNGNEQAPPSSVSLYYLLRRLVCGHDAKASTSQTGSLAILVLVEALHRNHF
jgi:hypothetical protein